MTTPRHGPTGPPGPFPPRPTPPDTGHPGERNRGFALAVALAAAILGGLTIQGGYAAAALDAGSDPPPTTAASSSANESPAAPAYVSPTYVVPTASYQEPAPSHYELTLKILSKECFGSAGCNVEFRVNLGTTPLGAASSYDPAKTYELVYEIRGGEDGASTNTMTISGDNYERDESEFAQTRSRSTKLTAHVISVEEL